MPTIRVLKIRVLLACLLGSLCFLQLAGCASTPESRATGQVIDDSALTARIKAALARDAGVSEAFNVNVTTYRGVVQLSGFVDSEAVKRRAEDIAQKVDGVRSVDNDLRVAAAR